MFHINDTAIVGYAAIGSLILGFSMLFSPNRTTLVDTLFTIREFVLFLFLGVLTLIIADRMDGTSFWANLARWSLVIMTTVIYIYIGFRTLRVNKRRILEDDASDTAVPSNDRRPM
jgi:hypothetical protein